MRRGEQPWKRERARVLRSEPPTPETLLWLQLRDRRLSGIKFVRQQSIATDFADFCCRAGRLVVEIDGETHGSAQEIFADHARDARMAQHGYRVLRVTNEDVMHNLDGVLTQIVAELELAAAPHPNPLPLKERGRGNCVTRSPSRSGGEGWGEGQQRNCEGRPRKP